MDTDTRWIQRFHHYNKALGQLGNAVRMSTENNKK